MYKNSRFAIKISQRKQRRIENDQKIVEALKNPDDVIGYKKARRQIRLRQFFANMSHFGKWFVIELLLLLPIYLAYSQYEIEVQDSYQARDQLTSSLQLVINYQIQLLGYVFLGLLILCGFGIMKHGWYHRKYKRDELANELIAQYQDQIPDEPKSTTNNNNNTKTVHHTNRKRRKK